MTLPLLPANTPRKGEVFRHYKGDLYKVGGLALDSHDAWVVVYEPLYENPAAELFVRPVAEWSEIIVWQGKQVKRFEKV